jgi:hypothetical protein
MFLVGRDKEIHKKQLLCERLVMEEDDSTLSTLSSEDEHGLITTLIRCWVKDAGKLLLSDVLEFANAGCGAEGCDCGKGWAKKHLMDLVFALQDQGLVEYDAGTETVVLTGAGVRVGLLTMYLGHVQNEVHRPGILDFV